LCGRLVRKNTEEYYKVFFNLTIDTNRSMCMIIVILSSIRPVETCCGYYKRECVYRFRGLYLFLFSFWLIFRKPFGVLLKLVL
jgi:hypothetical protein